MNKPRGRPFAIGNPGGPGRPKGSRNRKSALEKLLDQVGEPLLKSCINYAAKGHPTAMKLLIERILPRKRHQDKLVKVELPPIATLDDLAMAHKQVLDAVTSGQITTDQSVAIAEHLQDLGRVMELSLLQKAIKEVKDKIDVDKENLRKLEAACKGEWHGD